MSTEQIPTGAAGDNDYQSRTGQSEIPVQRDEAPVESTEYDDGGDSDKQLGKFIYALLLVPTLTRYRARREGCHR
jgi:hypothetical protein